MTRNHPPRLALWVLERFGPDNEPLAGDLVEAFELTGSRIWFWRQVLAAVLFATVDHTREIRPLRLVDRDPLGDTPRPPVEWRSINLTGSPIHGIGGLGLVALGVAISGVDARLWWVALATVLLVAVTGVVLGLALIVRHRPDPPQMARTFTRFEAL